MTNSMNAVLFPHTPALQRDEIERVRREERMHARSVPLPAPKVNTCSFGDAGTICREEERRRMADAFSQLTARIDRDYETPSYGSGSFTARPQAANMEPEGRHSSLTSRVAHSTFYEH